MTRAYWSLSPSTTPGTRRKALTSIPWEEIRVLDSSQSEQLLLPVPSDAVWERLLRVETDLGALDLVGREVIRHQASVLVERLRFSRHNGRSCSSVVAKVVLVGARFGAWSPNRVPYMDSDLYRKLCTAGAPLPKLHWAGEMPNRMYYGQVTEDLGARACLYDHEHVWSQGELEAIAEAVAAFHAAGLRIGGRNLTSRYPWLAVNPLQQVNGRWIADVVARAEDPTIQCRDQTTLTILSRVACRYDAWIARLAPWQTTIHGDVFWGNVALHEERRGRYEATLLDPDGAILGLPQYDVEYLTQRGWVTSVSWEDVRDYHRKVFSRLAAVLSDENLVWRWGYRVALLQLMLWGHWSVINIRARGCQASEREIAWAGRMQLFAPDFVKACEDALDDDPFR